MFSLTQIQLRRNERAEMRSDGILVFFTIDYIENFVGTENYFTKSHMVEINKLAYSRI